jgi:hypothetical protein
LSNRITLEDLDRMTVQEISQIPLDELEMLIDDANELQAKAKRYGDWLALNLAARFAGPASELRKAAGKDTGTVRVEQGDYVIVSDLPKRPKWDQRKLHQIRTELFAMGEPADEYIGVKYEVSERAYSAWPTSLRSLLEPARTLETGKPNYRLERVR